MGLPYENATSGKNAIAEMQRICQKFGSDDFGVKENFKTGNVLVQFESHGRVVRIEVESKNLLPAPEKKHDMLHSKTGEWVRYTEYKTLVDECDALKAALKSNPTAFSITPRIKLLVWWEPAAINNWTRGAETIFGTYYVGVCGGRYNAHAEFFHERGRIEEFVGPNRRSLFEGQSDAQAHHEARIRSNCYD